MTSINNSSLTNDGVINNDSNDLFGIELLYNPSVPPSITGYPGSGVVPKLYSGDITAIKWKTDTKQAGQTPQEQIYGFEYDGIDRFKKAYYASNNAGGWSADVGLYNEGIKSYDKNGNIQGIDRQGKVEGVSAAVDNTTYGYAYSGALPSFGGVSNRLLSIADAGNTYGFKDGAAQLSEEYKYDVSGNLIFDSNKGISSISYNYLNLPVVIAFTRPSGAVDRIIYTYNAAGSKLKTEVYKNGTSSANRTLVWKTDYVAEIQYDNNQLSFMATPEGRVVNNGGNYEYEYFYKDHQSNATSNLGIEENATFKNIASTRYNDPQFNYTRPSEKALTPSNSSQTNSFYNRQIGPAKSLRIAAGDKVKMEVFAKYNQVTGSTATTTTAALVSAVATSTFGFSPGEAGFTSFNNNAPNIPGIGSASATLPKAYLAYLFLDDSYGYVTSSAVSISTSAFNSFEKLERVFTATQSGYLYVYVANEASTPSSNVYFDEMAIVHQKNNNTLQVTQASDYYPFGLSFNNYQAERIKNDLTTAQKNRYGFQGQEWQADLDLGWSQFKWRMHDPAIGRFVVVDPLSDNYQYNSIYAFSENHVITHIELEGLEKVTIHSNSFIPYKTLGLFGEGGNYRGDNRGFGEAGASRISTSIPLDLTKNSMGKQVTSGARTYDSNNNFLTYSDAQGSSSQYKFGDNNMFVFFDMEGNNEAIKGSPDIDVAAMLQVSTTKNEDGTSNALFSGMVWGDKFPANETYLTDQSKAKIFLGVSGADGSPFFSLPGKNAKDMSSFSFQINFDKDGNYSKESPILYNGKTYTIEEWNKQFTSKNASGNTSTNFR